MKRLLLAEDDFDFAAILKQYLELHQFEVIWAENGEIALDYFKNQTFDICVFDVMMPKLDGFSLAEKTITINPEIPFIFLTARKLKEDKIIGLKLGADDYIVKPFEVDELVLRLQNILKRIEQKRSLEGNNVIEIGSYIFDNERLTLNIKNHVQQLTEKEASLIEYLYLNHNQLLKRDQILMSVWKKDDYFSGRSMDVFISRLRKYFNSDPKIKIESVRNVGLEFKIEKTQ
ncbi:response regulator transcription factor [Flavobacterium johnsoniae]|uniref:Two component transcriptional regulator, winged helix family n=1 Tax=Flavobacterium johnsoniae (strain ATCC 17061 / DSM 2064 / JCM 8514 / BCRC 14874 / CCUG 350202 / NBRC 14942 / NCIMB 11054 / UW101) TaxID=376686 RepID=A5FB99_FLAJ1|nr:response regulator transcription factor [Flavobacterium johnsoniae]ABQ07520.1 two component transcriptional regulator, winged helix family [Flavobacterium johnsoniae UW101]OXE99421.1 DNA-binding response regulator [Flavobacterium johnsoniae UW101]WQG80642.1 response regulator transcription factor [Flavobacterium johnsoniae UW101]SHL10445.1 DNA-binding response regulator, OmpR family, contains REC and winged-helix (wHTH) domain [Flavobacterium johnsoniae]